MAKRDDDDRQGGFDFGSSSSGDGSEPSGPRDHDLYFGLLLDLELARNEVLSAARGYLRAFRLSARMRPELMLHVSLVNAGSSCGPAAPDAIAQACRAAANVRVPQFRLVFNRITSWPRGGGEATIAMLAGEGDPAVAALSKAIADAMKAVRGKSGGRSTKAHMTLAYGQTGGGTDWPIEPIGWNVREFVLIENGYGGRHVHHGRWPLEG